MSVTRWRGGDAVVRRPNYDSGAIVVDGRRHNVRETKRIDQAIHRTLHRVDETPDRVRSNVRAKTSWVVGLVRGLHVVLEGLLRSRPALET